MRWAAAKARVQRCDGRINHLNCYENYGYHPAGAVTGKSLVVTRQDMGSDGWPLNGTATTGVAYSYDEAGRVASTSYQVGGETDAGWVPDTFTYSYNSMGRPASLTDRYRGYGSTGWAFQTRNQVSAVTYDVGGRMTGLNRYMNTTDGCDSDDNSYPVDNFIAESRGYNFLGQLTSKQFSSSSAYCWEWLGSSGTDYDLWSGGLQYTFSATQNNGQITQMRDTSGSAGGENVSYQYDALKRLTQASATPITGSTPAAWTQTYGYDGFGNMTSKVVTGSSNTIPAIDPVTNRMTTGSDANGNMLSGAGLTLTYDEANRVTSATPISGGTEWFAYAPDNKRVYSMNPSGGETYIFYGARGENLGIYYWYDPLGGDCTTQCRLLPNTTNVWFAGMKVRGPTFTDRLGTERKGIRSRPYGEDVSTGTVDFATYQADSFSGVHYADQRFYSSLYGRFNTADQYQASAGPKNPGSWNRYSYTLGDPVNGSDPTGKCTEFDGQKYDDLDESIRWFDQGNFLYYGICLAEDLQVFANDFSNCHDATSCMKFASGAGNDGDAGAGGSPEPSCADKFKSEAEKYLGMSISNVTPGDTIGGHTNYSFTVADTSQLKSVLDLYLPIPIFAAIGLDNGSRFGVAPSLHIETTQSGALLGHVDLFNGDSVAAPLHWIIDVGIGHIPGVDLDFGCTK